MSPSRERFAADWLGLREPVDHRSRSGRLVSRLGVSRPGPSVRIVDLGCGRGSNLRYLSPRLGGRQHWVAVDHDDALLEAIDAPPGVTVERVCADLAEVFDDRRVRLDGVWCVTASALLDLVSARWLEELVESCRQHGHAALFALTYDGDVRWRPGDETDETETPGADDVLVRDAVNRHQHRDKGLGTALGPGAAAEAADRFRSAGFRVWLERTPWRLTRADSALARPLIQGWAEAAGETMPGETGRLRQWAADRLRDLSTGRVELTVGHVDLLAEPPDA